MYELPTYILIDDVQYNITKKGDYRVILDCFSALNDTELDESEQVLASLLIFYENFDSLDTILNEMQSEDHFIKLINEMFKFFNCGQVETVGASTSHNLIDWDGDSQIICSAINNVAGKEIRIEPYIHWWTFMGYYLSIGESVLSTIVSIRDKLVRGKKLEDYEKEFKRDNPQYFVWDARTREQKEVEELGLALWNSGTQE